MTCAFVFEDWITSLGPQKSRPRHRVPEKQRNAPWGSAVRRQPCVCECVHTEVWANLSVCVSMPKVYLCVCSPRPHRHFGGSASAGGSREGGCASDYPRSSSDAAAQPGGREVGGEVWGKPGSIQMEIGKKLVEGGRELRSGDTCKRERGGLRIAGQIRLGLGKVRA